MQFNNNNKRFAECAMEELSEEILGLSAKRRNYYNVINKQIQNLLSVIENVKKQEHIENHVHLLDKNIKANNYVNKIESGYREIQQDLNRFRKKHLKSIPCYQEIEYALTISDLDEKLFCKMIGMHFLHLGYFDIYKQFSDEVLETFKTPLNIHEDYVEAYSLLHKMLNCIDEDDMTLSIYWVNTSQGFTSDANKPHSLLFKLLKLEQLNSFRGDNSPLSIIKRLESSDLSKLWKSHRGEIGKIISKFIVDSNFNTEYQNLKAEVKKMLTKAYCNRGIYLYCEDVPRPEPRQITYIDSVSETSDQSEPFQSDRWHHELISEPSPQRAEDPDDDDESDVSTQSVHTNNIPIFAENISYCTTIHPMKSVFTDEGELVNDWLTALDTAVKQNNYMPNGAVNKKDRLFQQCRSCNLNENPSFISRIYHYPGYMIRRRVRGGSRVNHVALELTHLPASSSNLNLSSNMTVIPTFAFTLLTGDPDDTHDSDSEEPYHHLPLTSSSNRRSLSITRILDSIRHQEGGTDGQVLQRILVANDNADDSTIRISPAREIITTGSNITLRDILHMIIRGFRTRSRPRVSRRSRQRGSLTHKPKSKRIVQVQEPIVYSRYRLSPLPYESALSLVFIAGYITHPRLVEILGLVLKERCEAATKVSNWLKSKRQLPLESDLGNSFHFHSHITCAVSKDQTCKSNPPVMMPCGHVICQYCVDKLCKNKTRQQFKCPMCPTLVEFHQTKVLDLA